MQSSGESDRENAETCLFSVIARSEATKQSRCFRGHILDCFAEPVIGPRFCADPLARNDDEESARYSLAVPFAISCRSRA